MSPNADTRCVLRENANASHTTRYAETKILHSLLSTHHSPCTQHHSTLQSIHSITPPLHPLFISTLDCPHSAVHYPISTFHVTLHSPLHSPRSTASTSLSSRTTFLSALQTPLSLFALSTIQSSLHSALQVTFHSGHGGPKATTIARMATRRASIPVTANAFDKRHATTTRGSQTMTVTRMASPRAPSLRWLTLLAREEDKRVQKRQQLRGWRPNGASRWHDTQGGCAIANAAIIRHCMNTFNGNPIHEHLEREPSCGAFGKASRNKKRQRMGEHRKQLKINQEALNVQVPSSHLLEIITLQCYISVH